MTSRRAALVVAGWMCAAACGGGDSAGSTEGAPGAPSPGAASAADADPVAPDAPGGAPELPPASAPSLRFRDGTASSGLAGFRQVNGHPEKRYVVESVGAGLALLDADGDGSLDAYLTNGSTLEGFADEDAPRDALYLGRGDGTFEPAPASAGVGSREWTGGARVADYDGDGDPDVLLTGFGRDALLANEGGAFTDVGVAVGVADTRWTTGAAFLDYDRDGDLDLYVVRHIAFDRAWIDANVRTKSYLGATVYFGPRGLPAEPDALYRNDDGSFVDVSSSAGVDGAARFGFQAVAFDQDKDGLVDLYVANDSQANLFWRNGGDGTFVDEAERLGIARSRSGLEQAGMGVAVGDSNGDARLDLYVTNFSQDYFTLYESGPNGFFRDRTRMAGLALDTMASLGWGAGMVDLDLDGDLDLFVANGHVYPQMDRFEVGTRYRQRNQVFENDGEGRFSAVPAYGGLLVEESSRGAAFGDVDGDGDVDVLVANLDAAPTLLLNDSERRGDALRLLVEDAGGNRDAVGARVELLVGERTQMRSVGAGSGFLSTDEPELTFGLPAGSEAAALRVTWPDGAVDEHADVAPGAYRATRGALTPRG